MASSWVVEKARISDVPEIHRLVNLHAARGDMLARPLSELYETIRDYFVVRDGDKPVACVALHVNWSDLAEVKALAVAPERQDQGLGALLVEACLGGARELGIATVFCLTLRPVFFEKLGFRRVEVNTLPRKVWIECYRCPKFPNCDEVALVYETHVPSVSSPPPEEGDPATE